jgi:hypothetical protein
MDHFLWAFNPQKKVPATGLQGYIIDTVKGCWLRVEIFNQEGTRVNKHLLTMIAGTGDNMQDRQSAHRASRWYNAWLIVRKIKEADIEVVLPSYSGDERAPVTRVEYVKEEIPNVQITNSSGTDETGSEESLTPVRQLNAGVNSTK